MHFLWEAWHYAGVFHTRHEDQQSGRVWEGIIKYHIGATLDQPDVSPDKRLSVCYHASETKAIIRYARVVCNCRQKPHW